MAKGIRLEGNEQDKLKQINDYIGELGGKKIRRKRNPFSSKLYLNFNTKRTGNACGSSSKRPSLWDDQACFGFKTKERQVPWGRTYDEVARVTSKAKGQYSEVDHFTLVDCSEECWKTAIVVCVRTTKVSDEQYMTAHVAGECPYCKYHVSY
jgi:hypothetical protein